MPRSHCEMGEDRATVGGAGTTGSTTTSSTCSIFVVPLPGRSKRERDPEDEVYLDSLHSHKCYLSEFAGSIKNQYYNQSQYDEGVTCMIYVLWEAHNRCRFEGIKPDVGRMLHKVQTHVFHFMDL